MDFFTLSNKLRNLMYAARVAGGKLLLMVLLTFASLAQLHAQITVVGSNTATGTSSVTITKPAGVQVGDLMIVNLQYTPNNAMTYPTGWTERTTYEGGSGSTRTRIAYKVAVAADLTASDYTFSVTSGTRIAGGISVFRGVNTTGANGGIDVIGTPQSSQNNTTITIIPGAITTTSANSMVLFFSQLRLQNLAFNADWKLGGVSGTPMDQLYIQNAPNVADGCGVSAAYFIQPTAGTTGTGYQTTQAGNARRAGILMALTPVPSASTLAANTVVAASICNGATKVPVQSFTIAQATANTTLSAINFTTTGSYAATDVVRFQLWTNTSNNLGTATQIGSNITTSLGPGSKTFSSLSQTLTAGQTRFFWITADIATAPASGQKTLAVNALGTGDFTVSGGSKTGSSTAGGTQTLFLTATVNKTNLTAIGANDGTITLTAPSGGSGSYEYRLGAGSWQSSNIFSNLAAGTYSVQIRDANANSCTTTLGNVNIDEPTCSSTVNEELIAVADAEIWTNSVNENYGSCETIFLRGSSPTDRGLFQFNLSSIPSNAIINSAILRLTKTGGSTNTHDISVHRVTNAWTEGTGNCTTDGTPNTNVTWNNRNTGTPWNTSGGDFVLAAEATVSVSANTAYDWNITNLVSDWVAGNVDNNGVLAKFSTETSTVYFDFASRENAASNSRPRLFVTYSIPITASVSKIDATCVNANNGSISVSSPLGGSGAYQYRLNGGSWQNSGSFPNLLPGTYSVQIRDANDIVCAVVLGNQVITGLPLSAGGTVTGGTSHCSATNSTPLTLTGFTGNVLRWQSSTDLVNWQNITNTVATYTATNLSVTTYFRAEVQSGTCAPAFSSFATVTVSNIVLTPNITQPTCTADGAISLSASGGAVPYTYDWSDLPGSNNPQNRIGLTPGTYQVTVTDANGCTLSSGSIVLNTPTCANLVVCQSETAQFFSVDLDPQVSNYLWTVPSGASIVSGQGTSSILVDFTGVSVGTYEVCVEAENDCGISDQQCRSIDVKGAQASATANPTCEGGNILLFASGGGTYAWSGPNGFISSSQNPVIFNATPANTGTYIVTVTTADGCTATESVVVTVPAPPTLSVINNNNANCGQNDGVINLTVAPAGTYNFLWSTGATGEDISGLFAGNYTVTVTDQVSGCTVTETYSIIDLPGPVVSIAATDLDCFDNDNGTATVTITSATTAPYTYAWSNNTTTTNSNLSNTINNLAPGSYSVQVTDNNGCKAAAAISVKEPAPLTLDFTRTNISCFNATTGSINLIVRGGTPGYTYAWSGPTAIGDTPNGTNLAAGTYNVTVTDQNNCSESLTITLTQPAQLTVTPTPNNVLCSGGSNGAVSLAVSGGTNPLTYVWTGPGGPFSTKDLSGLVAGTYDVVVTDAAGCFTAASAVVNQPTELSLSTSVVDVNCFGDATGEIDLTVTGGVGSYTYFWSNNAVSQDLTGLTAGAYNVTVTDANGCTATTSASIAQPVQGLQASASKTDNVCFGESLGSITLTVNGGTPDYTYSWLDGPTTQNRTDLAAGLYAVTVADDNNCTTSLQVNISQPSAIAVNAFTTDVVCNGEENGTITLIVSGGIGSYTYNWSGGLPATKDQEGLPAGLYTVTVSDANLCSAQEIVNIGEPTVLSLSGLSENISCNGANDGAIDLTVSGGVAPYTFDWSNNQSAEDISNLSPGTYSVTVTDLNLCTATETFNILEPDVLIVTATVTPNCPADNNGSVSLSVNGGTTPYQFNWTGGGSGTNPRTGLSADSIFVVVTDDNGCAVDTAFDLIPLDLSLLEVSITCFAPGEVFAVPSGGIEPYSYSWNTGATTQGISGLIPGTYEVTVTSGACSLTESLLLLAPICLPPVAVDDFDTTLINIPVTGTVAPPNPGDPGYDSDPLYPLDSLEIYPLTFIDPEFGVILWDTSFNGTYTFIPALNFVGTVSVIYTICNPLGLCDDAVLTITVYVENRTVALNDEHSTFEGIPASGNVTINDFDIEGDEQTFGSFLDDSGNPISSGDPIGGIDADGSPVTNAGTLVFDNLGNYTFTPAPGFTGIARVPYSICDDGVPVACDSAVLEITVSPFPYNENSVIANNDEYTSLGEPVTGDVLLNDADPQNDNFVVTSYLYDNTGDGNPGATGILGVPVSVAGVNRDGMPNDTAGVLTFNVDGTFEFIPVPGFFGEVPLVYTICDDGNPQACAQATVIITVIPDANGPANNPPVAGDDFAYTSINTPVDGNFIGNDFDLNGDPLSVNGVPIDVDASPASIVVLNTDEGGTVELFTDGTFIYTPPVGFTGPDRVTYTICDITVIEPQPLCASATIHLLTGTNNTTYAINDENGTLMNLPVSGDVTTNDFDVEGHNQTFGTFLDPQNLLPILSNAPLAGVDLNGNPVLNAGTLSFANDGTYTFTPATDFVGTVSVPYNICDDGYPQVCDTATLTITVSPRNLGDNSVIANNDEYVTYAAVAGNLFDNDRDPQGDDFEITFYLFDDNGDGIADAVGNLNGLQQIGGIDQSGNPVVNAGTIQVNEDGTFTFVAEDGFVGEIVLIYNICDEGTPVACARAEVTINVLGDANGPLNDPPFAGDDFVFAPFNTPTAGTFIANDYDLNGDSLSYNGITINPSNGTPVAVDTLTTVNGGTVVIFSDGTYLYTPPFNYFGPDLVVYEICDATNIEPQPLCAKATIHMLVAIPNTTYAVNDESSTWQQVPVGGNVTINDFDVEKHNQIFGSFLNSSSSADILSGAVVSGIDVNGNPAPNAGTLTFDANGNYIYTPAAGFVGTMSVPYRICDDGIPTACDTALLQIAVRPLTTTANSVIANNDEYFSLGFPVVGNFLVNDADPQGDNFLITTYTYDSNGDGFPDATGNLGGAQQIGGFDFFGNPVANAGSLTLNSNGTFNFVPANGFAGVVNLDYNICDDGTPTACDDAIVTIYVLVDENGSNPNSPSNDPPVAGDDFVYTSINAAVGGNFASNDYDLNADPISLNGITIIPNGPKTPIDTLTTVQGGSVIFYADGTFTYLPPLNYTGPDRVGYEICDVTIIQPQPLCASATIHMLVGDGITINGLVWQDPDGSVTINNGELGTSANTDLYVNVVDGFGRVVGVTKVNADGTYSLDSIPAAANLTLVLSLTQGVIGQAAPSPSLPAAWANTGQNFDGDIFTSSPGVLPFFSGIASLSNLDFGIELRPTAEDFIVNTIYYVNVEPTIQNPLEVLPEYFITDDVDGTVDSIRLIVFPTNVLSITINNITYTAANFPVNGITLPANESGQPIGDISVVPDYPAHSNVIIPFIPVDNAGVDGNLANITITFSAILPVELLSFEANANGCTVDLIWKTASEFNNDFFTIYRSADAQQWEVIGTVAGNGTTPLPSDYIFTDVSPIAGLAYYRLLQTDFDGTEEWHPIQSIDMSTCAGAMARVFPNPVASNLYVEVTETGNDVDAYLVLHNSAGQLVMTDHFSGTNRHVMNLSKLAAGSYILSVEAAEANYTFKIIVVR